MMIIIIFISIHKAHVCGFSDLIAKMLRLPAKTNHTLYDLNSVCELCEDDDG